MNTQKTRLDRPTTYTIHLPTPTSFHFNRHQDQDKIIMTVPPAAAAETELPTMINDDEFIENGTVTHENSSDNMNHNDGTTKSDSAPPHHKWIWLKAAFHCTVTLIVSC